MTTTIHHIAFRCQSKNDSGHPNPPPCRRVAQDRRTSGRSPSDIEPGWYLQVNSLIGTRWSGRSTSAQNRPFSALPRNSVTRTCPSVLLQIRPWWNYFVSVEHSRLPTSRISLQRSSDYTSLLTGSFYYSVFSGGLISTIFKIFRFIYGFQSQVLSEFPSDRLSVASDIWLDHPGRYRRTDSDVPITQIYSK